NIQSTPRLAEASGFARTLSFVPGLSLDSFKEPRLAHALATQNDKNAMRGESGHDNNFCPLSVTSSPLSARLATMISQLSRIMAASIANFIPNAKLADS